MHYFCCDERRREAVKSSSNLKNLNGIDSLEVVDHDAQTLQERQRTLRVTFLNKPAPSNLTPDNVVIVGGERITGVKADAVSYDGDILVVHVNTPGDFSTYTLRLVKADNKNEQLDGLDPLLSSIDFSFKVECHSDFDCQLKPTCPPERRPQPEINYLAKDYASFKQLMLDRISLLIPQWKERNPSDIGIVLIELLAYVGDYLSYQQDAIATEAYLDTARKRISVRRHARLVDYFMHDGCNARVWVQVQVNADLKLLEPAKLLTQVDGQPVGILPNSPAYNQALAQQPVVFETMHTAMLYQAHNEMYFYTWNDKQCCLPKGAVRATLRDNSDPDKRLLLRAGDVLILEERLGPNTGLETDADPAHRHAIRLTRVHPEAEQLIENNEPTRKPGALETDPLTGQPVVEIEWHADDALPFSLCISAKIDKEQGQQYVTDISVVHGNIILADHGLTIKNEDLGEVPGPSLYNVPQPTGDRCKERKAKPVLPRFNPHLKETPLTYALLYDEENPPPSASAMMHSSPQDAFPAICELRSELNGNTAHWTPQHDLLSSQPNDTDFVVEVENNGTAYLRFGDYSPQSSFIRAHGLRPDPGTRFTASYRVGNGVRGNVGIETIAHIISKNENIERIDKVRNPLPAQGGVEPESIEHVRQSAPNAFRTQERAVTQEDYAVMAERHPKVQRAAATFRWTGSWHTVFMTIDRLGGLPVDDAFNNGTFKNDMMRHLDQYRMAGYDMEIDGPIYISLEIEILVCVKPDYFRGDVKAALLQVFSNRVLPDGRLGVFHPDNFTFGQPVYLSPLYAAAQAVEGVSSVQIMTFQRQGISNSEALKAGKLTLGRIEIARLDNDPNFPEHGVFRLNLVGGK
jgi:hypothetical protein